MTMKIKLPEHDHKLTNFLKVLLFSILMLLPFLDIGTRCGYVLLNKNAYQSYYGETINQKEYIQTDISDIKIGDYVYFIKSANETTSVNIGADNYIYLSIISWNDTQHENSNATYSDLDVNRMRIVNGSNNSTYLEFSLSTGNGYYFVRNSSSVNISFYYEGNNGSQYLSLFDNNFFKISTNEYSYLDNVFDYSIDKMANSPLYNWTITTGMYTGVNAMTTGLGITTPLFAILITYWMFLTIIYIILDIVLTLMTRLTHIFTKEKD